MKCNCGPLIKAIDAYIAKADNDLADALAAAGFIDPDGTLAEINTLEEKVAAALTAETDYILDALKESIDLETFINQVWPKLKEGDAVAQDLFDVFWEEFEREPAFHAGGQGHDRRRCGGRFHQVRDQVHP